MRTKPTVAIVGAGRLASWLAPALRERGYVLTEIIARESRSSLARARGLATEVEARASTASGSTLDADLIWFCVPDSEIGPAAMAIASTRSAKLRFAFHSSGALTSDELAPFRRPKVSTASVHPLMTFVRGAKLSTSGVPFAIEGMSRALDLARSIVHDLDGVSFPLKKKHKAAYHAWATMTSPLLLAFLTTLEQVAAISGISRKDAARMSLPIIRQTIANYEALGSARSFSGPLVRGDSATIAQHLRELRKKPLIKDIYRSLARAALQSLPTKNRNQIRRLLDSN